MWPVEDGPWEQIHMDHAIVLGIGLLLIVVDSFSGWPGVFCVADWSTKTVKVTLHNIFCRNGVPKTVVSDNAAEFGDLELCKWLRHIGCRPLKTPPYHPQSNRVAEHMVQMVKRGLKAYNGRMTTYELYLVKLLLSYRSIPHAGRPGSPSALMGRQMRRPLTQAFENDESAFSGASGRAHAFCGARAEYGCHCERRSRDSHTGSFQATQITARGFYMYRHGRS